MKNRLNGRGSRHDNEVLEREFLAQYSDLDAEANLLLRLHALPKEVTTVRDILPPDAFYSDTSRTVYRSYLRLAAAGADLDWGNVVEDLRERGELEAIGGAATVYNLGERETPYDATHYAQRILAHVPARQAAHLMVRMAGNVAAVHDPVGAVLAWRDEANAVLASASTEQSAGRYVVLTDQEVEGFEADTGLVGDVLYADSVAYLFAAKDTWKTFLAVSWACSIAADRPWLGRAVTPGPVVYVAAEGRRGIGKRIKAWKQRHGIHHSIDVLVVPMPVNLLDPTAVPALMAAINGHPRLATSQGRKPVLIVFDTLARSMDGGNENDTPDANAVTAAAGLLKATYACCVLIVHHSGHSTQERMRGNSALSANADTVLRIVAPALEEGKRRAVGSVVKLHSVHAKETDNFADIPLTTALESWETDAGETVSSLVMVAPDAAQLEEEQAHAEHAAAGLTKSQRTALVVLAQAADGLSSGDWWRASELPRRTFYEALNALIRQYGAVCCEPEDGKYRLTDTGRALALL